MSNIMELIEVALRVAKDKATAASIWSDSSAERREYCEAYDEARAAVLEAVEKLERDAAMLRSALETCVCAMQDYQAGIGITEMFDKGERMGRLALIASRKALEATNGQDH